MSRSRLQRFLMTSLVVLPALLAGNEEIGFVEEYGMAEERAEKLRKLIPGTEDHFYYHCLFQQQSEAWDKAAETLESWRRAIGETGSWQVMKNRQALLTYGASQDSSLAYLIERLGLRLNHEKERASEPDQHPHALPAGFLDEEALIARHLNQSPHSLSSFSNDMLTRLAGRNLSREQRTDLLQRLTRADVTGILDLILADMDDPRIGATFGSRQVHGFLTLAQLEELAKRRPSLLSHSAFVDAVVRRLAPREGDDTSNPEVLHGHMTRLRDFSRTLGNAFSELKSRILVNLLTTALREGKADPELFLEYLRLPRLRTHMSEKLRREAESVAHQDYRGDTAGLKCEGDEDLLVRELLHHLATSREDVATYSPYLTEEFVRSCVAEGRILAGEDPSAWSDWLNPGQMQELKSRAFITFPLENARSFSPGETPRLRVRLKNIDRLLVRVYEINTPAYYQGTGREVDTSINLDGLVSPSARSEKGTDGPYRMEERVFEFPDMKGRGVWIVEFIGSGLKSRALVQKGRLRCVEGDASVGQTLRVVDEEGKPEAGAAAFVAGREYLADETGSILIPFAPAAGEAPLVLRSGGFATLTSLERRGEQYRLEAGFHIERESFLEGHEGTILVRPSLRSGDRRLSLAALKDTLLTVTMTLLDGSNVTSVTRDISLGASGEFVHRIKTPPGLQRLEATFSAKVSRLLTAGDADVADSVHETFNLIDGTDKFEAPHLRLTQEGARILVTGKNGESVAHRTLQCSLWHQGFSTPLEITLQTGADGAVDLGDLAGVRQLVVRAPSFAAGEASFRLWLAGASEIPDVLQAAEGDVKLSWAGGSVKDEAMSLVSLRSGQPHLDLTDRLSVDGGVLTLRGLAAGDHRLWVRGKGVMVRVEAGARLERAVLGPRRTLELSPEAPLGLASAAAEGDDLVVRLLNPGPDARIHVIATSFNPAASPLLGLQGGFAALLGDSAGRVENQFDPNIPLGDEVRYILDRQSLTKYPGLMIPRPSLLLVPMELVETRTDMLGLGIGGGGGLGSRRGGRENLVKGGGGGRASTSSMVSSNLNFLGQPALVVANLRPGEGGEIRLPLKAFGPRTLVQVVACSREGTQTRILKLPAVQIPLRDRRLSMGLEPGARVVGVRELRIMKAGDTLEIADAASSDFRKYDSLPLVHSLFMALTGNATLGEFRFVSEWNTLAAEAKKNLYSKHACHELNFFIHEKDRPFFDAVVKPFLSNKKDKTFLDHWLLGNDLKAYAEPFEFARLNAVEKILLARRLERSQIAKLLKDQLELRPLDPGTLDGFFEKGLAMEEGGAMMMDFDNASSMNDPGHDRRNFAGKKAWAQSEARDKLGMKQKSLEAPRAPAPSEDAGGLMIQADEPDGASEMEFHESKGAYDAERARAAVYLALTPTKTWIENNYHHLRPHEQGPSLVEVDDFWLDYAATSEGAPFLSSHLDRAAGNFTEMMFALAVLGLPERAAAHEEGGEGSQYTLKAASPLIALVEESRPAGEDSKAPKVLLGQNIYPAQERHRRENGEQVDNFITGDLEAGKVYGCEVVITNPSSRRLTLGVMAQIPRGALAVNGGRPTLRRTIVLEAHATGTLDFFFYFPEAGSFTQGGAQVSCRGDFSASTAGGTFMVRAEPAPADKGSWDHVSQEGSTDEVCAFIEHRNLLEVNLERAAFRLRDKEAYESLVGALEKRLVFSAPLWAYAFRHGDVRRMRTYLENSRLASEVGPVLECELLTVDPIARGLRVHTEFDPLVNARAYRLGGAARIANAALMGQYREFLAALAHRARPTAADRMTLAYFLFLQDRVEEALGVFAKVPRECGMELQHDYMQVCAAIFTGDLAKAREIAASHQDHPVERWRSRFSEALRHLDEAEGKAPAGSAGGNEALGDAQPLLALTNEDGKLVLSSRSLKICKLSFHEVDLEQMFSINPFVKGASGCFSHVAARHVVEVELREGRQDVEVPEALRNRPLMVEASGGGLSSSAMFSRHDLSVQVMDRAGHLRVLGLADGKPVAAAYVKVYALLNDGRTIFHKDGTTDIRGRFDYAAVSTEPQGQVQRFAILVEAGAKGALIVEAAPPAR